MVKKVAVIGGGPAGLTAALEARQRGMDVILFEKGRIGENIRCAEGFFDSLRILPRPEAGMCFHVDQLIIQCDPAEPLVLSTDQFHLWMIDRRTWQISLAKKAAQAGAIIEENSPVDPDQLTALSEEYDAVIDASGIPSVTSVKFGFLDFFRRHRAVTYQEVLRGDFRGLGHSLKVSLRPDFHGYFWVFPKSAEQANVGIGYFTYQSSDRVKERFAQIAAEEGLANCQVERSFGGIIPTRLLPGLTFGNILLAGDAAGLASPVHGGGIDLAVVSGRLAAQAASENDLAGYTDRIKSIAGPRLELETKMTTIWRRLGSEGIVQLLDTVINRKLPVNSHRWRAFRLLFSERDTVLRAVDGFINGSWPQSSTEDRPGSRAL